VDKLLSMSQTAKLLNITTYRPERKTVQLLRKLEISRKIEVLIKVGSKNYTTEQLLKNALPQLFVEDINNLETINSLKETIKLLKQTISTLNSKLNQANDKIEELSVQVKKLQSAK